MNGVTYWITGLSGAGKTTIGNRLYYELKKNKANVVLLDGDILKEIFTPNGGYTKEDRKKRAFQYASLCKTLSDQGIYVICCTIAMFEEVRKWNRKNNSQYVEVFLDVPIDILKKRDQKGLYSEYESGKRNNMVGLDMEPDYPKNPDLVIKNMGELTVKECVDKILGIPVNFNSDYDRDTNYWNDYYLKGSANMSPSLFAEFVASKITHMGTLLDLGCGNGRDSKYFRSLGYNVTGVDASPVAINKLTEECKEDGNIFFICDDFVSSVAIYAGQYDYCYSRFSLHAITAGQERELMRNVFKVLKTGGAFFIEARGIHDTIYGKGECIETDTYIYNGHFRRFLRMENLLNELIACGFNISYSEENTGFAPFEDDDPPIIRVIAEKP